ncbi:MAG TPA: phosphorylase, partial [Rikenellaceae bacterium]|nr:phosphorylase [Rikenellaceae bacterium]
MRIAESELIINDDGSAFHIHLKPEELADIVILVGDPGRVDMVAGFLTELEFRHQSREFVSTTGKYNGKRITVLSTGIGTDNIDIVMTELDALANVDFTTREPKEEHRTLTILRIGTCGAVQADIPLGSAIFSHYSVGCDGLMNWYANRDEL